jgi:acyl-homoserine lactone acylase PvdQ
MNEFRRPPDTRRIGARILDTAEGVLVALRRYPLDWAFVELMQTAKRHGVNPVSLADALVALAETRPGREVDDTAAAVALRTWGQLFDGRSRNDEPLPDLPGAEV